MEAVIQMAPMSLFVICQDEKTSCSFCCVVVIYNAVLFGCDRKGKAARRNLAR